jgi:hypothetical protein
LVGNESSIAASFFFFPFQIGSTIAEEEEPGSRLERKEQLLEKIEQGGTTTPKKRYLSPGGESTKDQGTSIQRPFGLPVVGTVPSSVRFLLLSLLASPEAETTTWAVHMGSLSCRAQGENNHIPSSGTATGARLASAIGGCL